MNPNFQVRGRGTGPLCLPYPHPDMSEANLCFQASKSQSKESFTRALQVQCFDCQDKPRSGIKTQTICLWAQLNHNWKHTFCPSNHSSASSLRTQDTNSAHFQRKPAKSHRRHNCGLQGSAYAHCTGAYLSSMVSATLASLLSLNTSQLLQTAITHSLQKLNTSTVDNLFLVKNNFFQFFVVRNKIISYHTESHVPH